MSDFGDRFCLTLITDDPGLAAEADNSGVDRIGIDIERLNKAQRQPDPAHRISQHGWSDLARLAPLVRNAELFVRLNPLHGGTEAEIDTALQLGARVVMLPFFTSLHEPARFLELVAGRARTVLLVETVAALAQVQQLVRLDGVQELMLGLNDLRLQLGIRSPFEVLTSTQVAEAAALVHAAGLRFTVGGVGRVGDNALPMPADLVHAQYPRLGATGAWLARSFFTDTPSGWTLAGGLAELRGSLSRWARQTPDELERARCVLLKRATRTLEDSGDGLVCSVFHN